MAEGFIPRQRTKEDSEEVIKRIGELEIEPLYNGQPAPLKQELDEIYGEDGWGAREVSPNGLAEKLYHNMGLLILEVYTK
jgi:hypothetical protein